jgi:shikimate kinase
MMGAGKSTVGPILAERLGQEFVDLDAEIERVAGARIVEMFEHEGEEGFRRREREALHVQAARGAVVALGGGAIAQQGAIELLRETGVVVYLRGRVSTLAARLRDCSERPLLRGLSKVERVARLSELLGSRESAYQSAAVVVDIDERTPEEVVELALRALRQGGK